MAIGSMEKDWCDLVLKERDEYRELYEEAESERKQYMSQSHELWKLTKKLLGALKQDTEKYQEQFNAIVDSTIG